MRRVLFLTLTSIGLVALSGCPAKPKKGECKTSQDCLKQQGFGSVCVDGRCQECGRDSDCKEGFVCRSNTCVPKPQCTKDADCPEGQRCEGEQCVTKRDSAETAPKTSSPEGEHSALPSGCAADFAALTIRFGFDQATLSSDARGSLQKLAECLRKVKESKLGISGYADERGTTQYNIALGARRAESARKYLHDLGVAAKLDTVSYGKEKPLCSDHTEECWARNRRVEFQGAR